MAAKGTNVNLSTSVVQEDWKNREFNEIIHINVLKLVQFLNEFDVSVRSKLGTLNEKLNKIERNIEYLESSLKSSLQDTDEFEMLMER